MLDHIRSRLRSLQTRVTTWQEYSPRAFTLCLTLLAVVTGAVMSGLGLSSGRSLLFAVTVCISIPVLFLLPDKAKVRLILLACAAALIFTAFFAKSHVWGDAPENVNITYNILNYSVYTTERHPDSPAHEGTYSSKREPLLPFTLLPFAYLALDEMKARNLPKDQWLDELYVHPYLKGATVLWSCLLLFGMWKLGSFRNRHFIAVWLAMSFTFVYFCREEIGIMHTEITAAALLVWLAWCYLKALDTGRKRWLLIAGGLAAGMALTKMLFLYLFVCSTPLLSLSLLWRGNQSPRKTFALWALPLASFAAVMGLYVALTVAAHPGISPKDVLYSDRGNDVLAMRALKNNMTADERVGALYAYSRGSINSLFGFLLHADKKDVERGGRWERLSRGTDRATPEQMRLAEEGKLKLFENKWYPIEECRSYYIQAKIPETAARGKELVLENLPLHLAMTPIFLYRGVFGLATGSTGLVLFLYCAAVFFASYVRKKPYNMTTLWFPLGMLAAYALTSHFIPRYAVPMSPILVTFFCVHLAGILHERFGMRNAPGA